MKTIKLLYIDLFCGAGGTSTGVQYARNNGKECAKVIACVNHDKNAIASHSANHPETLHFIEDIRTLELSTMINHLKTYKSEFPTAKIVLWASLECTNFSKAKGGMPRDADSRTLAEHLFRYIEAINPDYIKIENVQEFMSWGDMDDNGKPIFMDRGRCYNNWVQHVQSYGYRYDYKILNSADYGAFTSRKRYFGIFAKDNLPIVFPRQTHSKNGELLPKWNAVKEVLDFSDEGVSIFGRTKNLSEKTLERIYAGLIKFVAGGKDKWILKYNSINKKTGKHIPPSIDEPCHTISCQGRLGIITTNFLSRYNTVRPQDTAMSLEEPCGVITTHNRFAKVGIHFLSKQYSGHPASKNISINGPSGTITTKDHHTFISAYYGNGYNRSLNSPAPTITCKDRFSLVSFNYLMNPQFTSKGGSVNDPCFTLIARMDKMPPYLITTNTGAVGTAIYQSDSPMTIKIKQFMATYEIVDIKMRMLKIPELKQIMGFPKEYVLIGTQAEQKKYIGNAVEVNMARVLCESLCNVLN